MKLSPQRLVLILFLLAGGVYAAVALRPRPVPVEAAAVVRGPLRVTVTEEGETRIHHRYAVAAPVAGRLERIALHPGDAVAAGEAVARLDPAPLDRRSREQAKARLAAAEASRREADAIVRRQSAARAQARLTLARYERLAAEQVIAADEVEAARTAARTADSDLEAASHRARAAAFEVANARAALLEAGSPGSDAIQVLAPVGGRVLRVCEECEKVVAAGTPLLEVGDLAGLEVVVDLLTTDAVQVRPGAAMLLQIEGEAPLRARVRTVEPSGFTKVSPLGVEEQRVNVIGDLVDPPGRLGDRFRVEAEIVLWQASDVLKVPTGALFREDQGWAVFAVEDGRARRRAVKIGHRNPDETEIQSGLKPGETVVVHPSDAVKDGKRVGVQGGRDTAARDRDVRRGDDQAAAGRFTTMSPATAASNARMVSPTSITKEG